MSLEEFFSGYPQSRQIFDRLYQELIPLGALELRVTKSQVALRRKKAFAWVWIPGRYLPGSPVPLVLTVALRQRDPSPRWKEIVEPYPGRFTHHLELRSCSEIDAQVLDWLQHAWEDA